MILFFFCGDPDRNRRAGSRNALDGQGPAAHFLYSFLYVVQSYMRATCVFGGLHVKAPSVVADHDLIKVARFFRSNADDPVFNAAYPVTDRVLHQRLDGQRGNRKIRIPRIPFD